MIICIQWFVDIQNNVSSKLTQTQPNVHKSHIHMLFFRSSCTIKYLPVKILWWARPAWPCKLTHTVLQPLSLRVCYDVK